MYFRCPACLLVSSTDKAEELVCYGCGMAHLAAPHPDLGTTPEQQEASILKLSKAEGIDSPTACSVLLGLTTLRQAAASPATIRSGSIGAPVVESSPLDIDPKFREAVDQGHLTIAEAVRRVDRGVYAAGLMSRHRLPEPIALKVADNRTTLFEALCAHELADVSDQASESFVRPAASTPHTAVLVVLAATIVSMIAWTGWSDANGALPPVRQAVPATVRPQPEAVDSATTPADKRQERLLAAIALEVADDGKLVELSGPDPRSVLIAYCRAMAPGRLLEPLEIGETATGSRSSRLGHYRDLQTVDSEFAIRIRQDWKSRRWVAGTGSGPIPEIDRPGPGGRASADVARGQPRRPG